MNRAARSPAVKRIGPFLDLHQRDVLLARVRMSNEGLP